MTFSVGIGSNIRKSPYFDATVADGVRSFSVYNHMYIPGNFGDPAAEYQRLINGVAMWDVGAQRQVEITGPDAAQLVRYLCARDLSSNLAGQGRYVPICNHDGLLINDPVLLQLAQDRFWLSIADSDIELWASAIAAERGLDLRVFEPDVSPLAVQGPKAEDVIVALFGDDWPRALRYFGFRECELHGIPLVLARSGWSKQGGFELYLRDGSRGGELWERVKRAGAAFDIGPGVPDDIERIESGLLSYGADARLQRNPANPFELGLGKLVDLDRDDDFIGKQALTRIRAQGVKRRFTGFFIDGDPVPGSQHPLPLMQDQRVVGSVSEMAWSPRLRRNVALGLVSNEIGNDAGNLAVDIGAESRAVSLAPLPFVR